LNNLLENYLEPLKQETFLSSAEINALFGNIQEIVAFQRVFQQSLEEALAVEPHFDAIDQPYQFKVNQIKFPKEKSNQITVVCNNNLFVQLFLYIDRMFCLPSAALSCITPITSNCTVPSAPATPRLKKFYCQVNSQLSLVCVWLLCSY
jgi:hypothetical protein